MNAKILIVSTSLNPGSKSLLMAQKTYEILQEQKQDVELIDLKDYELPHCDGGACYGHSNVAILTEKIQAAAAVIMAVPIYNFDAGSAAKNLIELTGNAWQEKVVGFLCAAGGKYSYMSVMSLANSLMLDFRCLIIPSFVYADGSAFSSAKVTDSEVVRRIQELASSTSRLARFNAAPVESQNLA